MGRQMRIKPILVLSCLLAALSVIFISQRSAGQSVGTPSLITQPIDEGKLVVLTGNTHPLARAKYDQGLAPSGLAMDRMMLVLKTTSTQGAALETLLAEQQDRSSPNYHKWLTPQEFGTQFGASEADIQKITSWLQSRGFQVENVANGSRNVIQFSGNAAQVQSAFHTVIHKYTVNAQEHWANASDPSIPAALTPAVAGVASLNNFPKRAAHRFAGTFARDMASKKMKAVTPEFTFLGGCAAREHGMSICGSPLTILRRYTTSCLCGTLASLAPARPSLSFPIATSIQRTSPISARCLVFRRQPSRGLIRRATAPPFPAYNLAPLTPIAQ